MKAAVHSRIHDLSQVGRADEDPFELFHLSKQLVYLSHFPSADSSFPVSEKGIGFVKKKDAVCPFRLFESPAYILFSSSDITVQKVGSPFEKYVFTEFFGDIAHKFGLSRSAEPVEKQPYPFFGKLAGSREILGVFYHFDYRIRAHGSVQSVQIVARFRLFAHLGFLRLILAQKVRVRLEYSLDAGREFRRIDILEILYGADDIFNGRTRDIVPFDEIHYLHLQLLSDIKPLQLGKYYASEALLRHLLEFTGEIETASGG